MIRGVGNISRGNGSADDFTGDARKKFPCDPGRTKALEEQRGLAANNSYFGLFFGEMYIWGQKGVTEEMN